MRLARIEPGGEAFAAFTLRLTEAGLPQDDLLAEGGRYYALRESDGEPVAFGGLVAKGPDALVRSVVVPAGRRGRGLGAEVVEQLAGAAQELGVRTLWLLTTDAEAFFAARGFATVARDEAPAAVAGTQQFQGLCPASASLMRRRLEPSAS